MHPIKMRTLVVFLMFLGLATASPARERSPQTDEIEVDLELVLLVDVSRSMSERELEIQRKGYASALRSEDVFAALQAGLLQRVALTYVEWSGSQSVIVEWRLIETRSDLEDFADALTARFDPALRRTSISEALLFGAQLVQDNGYTGLRRVIDISGDGPNNMGRPVRYARDRVLEQGIIINGLPLMTREGMGSDWHLDRLDIYYETCVIGGPGAFVMPVLDWEQFESAVKRKLVLEMVDHRPHPHVPVGHAARVQPAATLDRDPTDCLIGEKIWKHRWGGDWGSP